MVTVIILTHNPGDSLSQLLEQINQQTLKPLEILIVDSDSSDNTADIASGYECKFISINHDTFDHGETRTYAVKQTDSNIIVFLTQDVSLENSEALEKLIVPLQEKGVVAVFGRQKAKPDDTIFAKHLRLFNYPEISYQRRLSDIQEFGIKTAFFSNSFSAYRRSILNQIDYFKSGLIFGEDTFAAAKILLSGKIIAYQAEAVAIHSHNYSYRQDFRRYFDMGIFHENEKWLLDTFGKAEGQGLRYLFSELSFIVGERRFLSLPSSVIRSIFKYSGYYLGRKHKYLPMSLCRNFSMNKKWWDKPGNLNES